MAIAGRTDVSPWFSPIAFPFASSECAQHSLLTLVGVTRGAATVAFAIAGDTTGMLVLERDIFPCRLLW
jgi:hypothetical protein